ncbi:hypothetical protein [Paucibacter soli]|uniref:hypothetical protein n=1 Tax=Paucibacter soli TaxID=3133433 RepID=UPI0030A31008
MFKLHSEPVLKKSYWKRWMRPAMPLAAAALLAMATFEANASGAPNAKALPDCQQFRSAPATGGSSPTKIIKAIRVAVEAKKIDNPHYLRRAVFPRLCLDRVSETGSKIYLFDPENQLGQIGHGELVLFPGGDFRLSVGLRNDQNHRVNESCFSPDEVKGILGEPDFEGPIIPVQMIRPVQEAVAADELFEYRYYRELPGDRTVVVDVAFYNGCLTGLGVESPGEIYLKSID